MGSPLGPGRTGAAFCFRMRQERPGWNLLELVPAKTTVDLAALVCGAPEFLGMDGAAVSCRAAIVLSERGDARVVAAIDEGGEVSLIGCPAQLTRGALTAVVQELLVFNGRLWRMPPDELAGVFEKRLGRSLGSYFSERAEVGWSENGFRTGLGRSLERGRFPIVLLLTGKNQDVVEAVAHLKSHNLEVKPLGVELYESSGVEVIVPRVLMVGEPGSQDDSTPARLVPRTPPPQPRTPPRSGPPAATDVDFGAREPAVRSRSGPARRRPWADEPAPVDQAADADMSVAAATPEQVVAKETPWVDKPAPVDEVGDADVSAAAPASEQISTEEMPPADEPSTHLAEIELPPAVVKPVTAVPPPAPRPAPPARPMWAGTMPGVMAGKRPPRRVHRGADAYKGYEQTMGNQM